MLFRMLEWKQTALAAKGMPTAQHLFKLDHTDNVMMSSAHFILFYSIKSFHGLCLYAFYVCAIVNLPS